MTPTEQKYKDSLGRLYVWSEKIWAQDEKGDSGWVWYKHLVMPDNMGKRGGWWHFSFHIIKHNMENTHGYPKWKLDNGERLVGCKEFYRHSEPATLSLLGDTVKKEVA